MLSAAASKAGIVSTGSGLSTGVDGKARIPELDGMRAIAVLLVIGCHYPAFAGSLAGLPEFGWVGVDIFFVLSGFLITSILLASKNKPDPYIPFLTRRTRRIMPPYFLVLLATVGAYWLFDSATVDRFSSVFRAHLFFSSSLAGATAYPMHIWRVLAGSEAIPSLAAHSLQLVPLRMANPGYPIVIDHLWSVSVEEWYYLLWAPIVLILPPRIVAWIAALMVLSAVACRWFGFSAWWYFSFFCRLDGLAIGSMLAFMKVRGIPKLAARVTLVACATCLCAVLLYLRPILGRDVRDQVLFAAFCPTLIAALVACAIASVVEPATRANLVRLALRHPIATYLGKRSYMLYLIHLPVYAAIVHLWPRMGSWELAGLSLVFSVAIAAASWRFFEAPILEKRHRAIAPQIVPA